MTSGTLAYYYCPTCGLETVVVWGEGQEAEETVECQECDGICLQCKGE